MSDIVTKRPHLSPVRERLELTHQFHLRAPGSGQQAVGCYCWLILIQFACQESVESISLAEEREEADGDVHLSLSLSFSLFLSLNIKIVHIKITTTLVTSK